MTMARDRFSARRWRLPLALLLVALLAATLIPAFAQGTTPPATPLVPNREPAQNALADAAPVAWPLDERAAVEATLAAFIAQGEQAPPEGAILDLPALQSMSDAELAATVMRVYLPLLRRPAELGQQPPPSQTPITPAPITPTPITPTPNPTTGADVSVTIWPKPSIWVARGGTLEYEVRLRNSGTRSANELKLVLPYNRAQLALAYSSLDSKAGDWVSEITSQSVTVTFGALAPGKTRVGKLFMRVGSALPHATLLDVRASYSWRDGATGGGQRANWTPVLVGSGPSDAPYIWVQLTPDRGAPGTQHRVFTNRFLPGEAVTSWLNTPQGVRPLSLRGDADADGAVALSLASTGLARGSYQLVLYGQRSGLTGVATFTVQ